MTNEEIYEFVQDRVNQAHPEKVSEDVFTKLFSGELGRFYTVLDNKLIGTQRTRVQLEEGHGVKWGTGPIAAEWHGLFLEFFRRDTITDDSFPGIERTYFTTDKDKKRY